MTDTTDDTELYERIGKKKQKNLTLPREVCGALDELIANRQQSAFVERAVWELLIDEYGMEVVLETIGDVQDDLDASEKITEAEPYLLTA